MKTAFFAVALGLLSVAGASAQPGNCSDGTIHDDGSFDTGVGWQSFASRGEYVMRIDPPVTGSSLDAACICWRRTGSDSSVFFNLKVWAADGVGGKPGTFLGEVPTLSATGVGTNPTWYRYNLTSLNIVTGGSVYIGPEWDPGDDEDFFVCTDTQGLVKQPAYGSSSILGEAPSSELGQVGFFPEYRALGVRAKFGEPVSGCVPSTTSLCLNKSRFQVQATYRTKAGQQGTAQVVKLTDETGYLWFFNSANVEAVVKILDACGLNNNFWVFAGGLTDVEVTLTVTDTETGKSKTYTNPQGKAFQPIQDTAALSCS